MVVKLVALLWFYFRATQTGPPSTVHWRVVIKSVSLLPNLDFTTTNVHAITLWICFNKKLNFMAHLHFESLKDEFLRISNIRSNDFITHTIQVSSVRKYNKKSTISQMTDMSIEACRVRLKWFLPSAGLYNCTCIASWKFEISKFEMY